MGQGASAAYKFKGRDRLGPISEETYSASGDDTNNNNNMKKVSMSTSEQSMIAALECQLEQKERELSGLREAMRKMPEFARLDGDVCFKVPDEKAVSELAPPAAAAAPAAKKMARKTSTAVLMTTYQPQTVTSNRRQIEDYCRDLVINNDHISKMEQRMRAAIEKGLGKSSHPTSTVKCFPTYVKELPSGCEAGKYLALDLGGTNFRVVVIDIGENKFEMDSKVYGLSKELMEGSGESLFDYIADCLANFVASRGLADMTLPLGFTFSFPCRQKGLAKGDLIAWTKGFKCAGVEGQDVVALLQKAIRKRGDVKVDVAALLNDTTGCLMSCAWKNPNCRIGLIIGTGTNACYLEEVDKVETVGEEGESVGPQQMIVNTEWGAFGDNGELDYIVTKWDRHVDAASLNPGKQIFEKMISGMYMGEVVRQVLVDLVNEGLIFAGQDHENLMKHGRFYTKYVSEIESDPVGVFKLCREALADLGLHDVTDEDCSALRYVCECVSRRAGFMVSAGISALLKKMDYKDVVVAIDGSVFRFHPHFPNIMKSRIAQLMGIDYKFDLMLSTDGSGRGAALVAAVLKGECAI